MHSLLTNAITFGPAQFSIVAIFDALWPYVMIFAGFSAVIFVHELGHFVAAKWAGVKVERFAIGFFTEVFGFTKGETRYSFNILPLGGYVKMLGQEDFEDKSGEWVVKDDPRAFPNKPVLHRMIIVSAGVVMNILFAALLFLIVFMYGVETVVPKVGYVVPESPAAMAGLQPGDTVRAINGRQIKEFDEIQFAVKLADPHTVLDFEIDRDGEALHLAVKPEPWHQDNLLRVGIGPAPTREVALPTHPRFDPDDPNHLQSGDIVTAIRGEDMSDDQNEVDVVERMRSFDGSPVPVTVERPPSNSAEGEATRRDVIVFNEMIIEPRDPINDRLTHDVLGLVPLVRIHEVAPKSRAALAGFKDGDVIRKWGALAFPTLEQIIESFRNLADRADQGPPQSWRERIYARLTRDLEIDIPVVVQRLDRRLDLEFSPRVTPTGRITSLGCELNRVGSETLLVAGVVASGPAGPTPAAEAGIPRGALIRRVADTPVSSWPELVEQFRLSAGSTVKLDYRTMDGQDVTTNFRVPHCLRTKLGLSTVAHIVAVNDQRSIAVEGRAHQVKYAVSKSFGLEQVLARILDESGGQPATVNVRYSEYLGGPELEREVLIDQDMLDPWFSRVKYLPLVLMRVQTRILRADGPIDAVGIGVKKTFYFVMQVYTMLDRMIFSRSVTLKQVSGPVGIVKAGGDWARAGFLRLLFFLAIISANLAVINFLPLPIVDGGLMVFLIIEKIKGSPVSLKVQMATQMIGVVLLLTMFLYVTFQDVLRWSQ